MVGQPLGQGSEKIFSLLFKLKSVAQNKLNDDETGSSINKVLWNIIQKDTNLEKKLTKDLIRNFVNDLKKEEAELYIKQMSQSVKKNTMVRRNLKLLKKVAESDLHCENLVYEELKETKLVQEVVDQVVQLVKSNGTKAFSEETSRAIKTRLKNLSKLVQVFAAKRVLLRLDEIFKLFRANYENWNGDEYLPLWLRKSLLNQQLETNIDKLKKFFLENLKLLLCKGKDEFFKFFMLIYFKINISLDNYDMRQMKLETSGTYGYKSKKKKIYMIKRPINEFFGYDQVWQLFLEADPELMLNIAGFYSRIYFPPLYSEKFDKKLYKQEQDRFIKEITTLLCLDQKPQIRENLCCLIVKMIRNQEIIEANDIPSLQNLEEEERVVLVIEKDTKYFRDRFSETFNPFSKISAIKKRIAQEYRMDIRSIKIVKENGKEISQWNNCDTIKSQGFKTRENLMV